MGQSSQLTGELNYIFSYFYNGCRTDRDVVIQLAQEPAGKVALSLLSFGWEDIVKSFWRPKGLRQHRHGRKRKKKGRGGGLPQINDILAEALDPKNDLFEPLHDDGLRIWWELENTIERVSYTIMLWDLIETFAFEVILGILDTQATKCEIPGRASIMGRNIETFNTGQLYDIECPVVKYAEPPCQPYLYGIIINDDNWYQILAGVTCVSRSDVGRPLRIRVLVDAKVGGGIYEKVVDDFGYHSSESSIFSGVVQGPGSVSIQVGCAGNMYVSAIDIRVIHSAFKD